MDFEHQKPVSEQYRENYDKVFVNKPTENPIFIDTQFGRFYFDDRMPKNQIDIISEDGRKPLITNLAYPNGCPVIEESNA
jgi:hypothetical protein